MTGLPSYEVRSITTEIRLEELEAGKARIRGYAAVFNSPSQILVAGGKEFVETIKPGAFSRALAEADVRGLFNHDANLLLGRRLAGTMQLTEDSRGLAYVIDPPANSVGQNVIEWLRRGDVTGSSFSFSVVADRWAKDDTGRQVRELMDVHLYDVGPVTFPAYLEASAAYRSLEQHEAAAAAAARTYPTPEQSRTLQRLALATGS